MTVDVGGMSREWMERFLVGRCDGHIIDGHLPSPESVVDYTGHETPANTVDAWSRQHSPTRNRKLSRSIAVDTLSNVY